MKKVKKKSFESIKSFKTVEKKALENITAGHCDRTYIGLNGDADCGDGKILF